MKKILAVFTGITILILSMLLSACSPSDKAKKSKTNSSESDAVITGAESALEEANSDESPASDNSTASGSTKASKKGKKESTGKATQSSAPSEATGSVSQQDSSSQTGASQSSNGSASSGTQTSDDDPNYHPEYDGEYVDE